MNRLDLRRVAALVVSLFFIVGVASVASPPSLSGRWVMLQVYPSIALVPMVGPSTQTNYVVLKVDVEQDDLLLEMSNSYCFSIVEENSPLSTTEIPDAFMQSLHPAPCSALLQEEEGGFTFQQGSQLEIRGAVLENPKTDELPTDPEDPRVIDQDEDGFPGMSVNINLLGLMEEQIYVVQRFQYKLEGAVISTDRIEGLICWTDEQVVLAATNQMLLAGSDSKPDPDPNKHTFIMIRRQEDWTCEWLREHWREVFELEEDDA
jgi:hypothetical protein